MACFNFFYKTNHNCQKTWMYKFIAHLNYSFLGFREILLFDSLRGQASVIKICYEKQYLICATSGTNHVAKMIKTI